MSRHISMVQCSVELLWQYQVPESQLAASWSPAAQQVRKLVWLAAHMRFTRPQKAKSWTLSVSARLMR